MQYCVCYFRSSDRFWKITCHDAFPGHLQCWQKVPCQAKIALQNFAFKLTQTLCICLILSAVNLSYSIEKTKISWHRYQKRDITKYLQRQKVPCQVRFFIIVSVYRILSNTIGMSVKN
jgi:hypothetical protein